MHSHDAMLIYSPAPRAPVCSNSRATHTHTHTHTHTQHEHGRLLASHARAAHTHSRAHVVRAETHTRSRITHSPSHTPTTHGGTTVWRRRQRLSAVAAQHYVRVPGCHSHTHTHTLAHNK